MLYDPHGNPLPPASSLVRDPLDGYDPVQARGDTPEFRRDLNDTIRLDGEGPFDAALDRLRNDAFVNNLTGLGTPWGDKTRGGQPGGPDFVLVPIGGYAAEARARGSDLGRNIVDKIPDEMTREGWDVDVQPSDEDTAVAGDPVAQQAAADAAPRRAAAGWRKFAGDRRLDSRRKSIALDRARRWDAVAASALPVEAAPPPPPGPLPHVNDEGLEFAEAIEKWADAIDAVGAVNQALRYERCFGGGAVFIGLDDGQSDLGQPVDPKRVKAVTHLTPFRGGWDGEITMWRPYNDPRCAKFGRPEIYQVRNMNVPLARAPYPGESRPTTQTVSTTLFYVHESRLLVFDGEPASQAARQEMRGWGDSVFTRVNDVLMQYEQTWNAVSILMQEFSVATLAIEGFTVALTQKGSATAQAAFLEKARFTALTQSVARMRFIDAKEKFDRTTATVAGVADILRECGPRLAAAADMPLSLLFGQTQGGLGNAGNTDLRWFYDRVASKQERRLRPQLQYLYSLGWRAKNSPTHGVEPERWAITFRPLWQATALEDADLRLKTTQADQIEITTQIITPEEVAATRYGGATYNPGPIVLDRESRAGAADFNLREAARNAQAVLADPNAGEAGQAGRGMMPTDPITQAPTGTPSEVGQTGAHGEVIGKGDGTADRPFDERLDEFARAALTLDGHGDQPRDERGRFVASGGASAAVAKSIAEHLQSKGIQATHEGGKVTIGKAGSVVIGKGGERTYQGTSASAKVQAMVEAHLQAQPKHVAAWAARTVPAAAAARLQAEKAARAAAPKVAAPRITKGGIDTAKVPGAGKGYQVVTTNSKDPEKGFKGRSFNCKSADDMKAEWLGAAAKGGTNGGIVDREVGGTNAREGGARDRAQFDAVRDQYKGTIRGAEKVETFTQAFKVLAQASALAAGNKNGAPNWKTFDLETLRACRGFEKAEVPSWIHEASASRQEAEHYASYYDHHGGASDSGASYDLSDVPF